MTQSKCKEPSDDDKPNFDEEVVTKEDQLNVVYFYPNYKSGFLNPTQTRWTSKA